jgi:hypothetical protein
MPGKNHIFSSDEKTPFLLIHNELVGFRGNRSFINIFPSQKKSAIREYFRENKLKLKEATDQEMEQLVSFINSMDHEGNM